MNCVLMERKMTIKFVSCRYRIQDRDLIDAYKAAGNMKNLEQLFMVLRNPENEKDDPKEAPEKRFRRWHYLT